MFDVKVLDEAVTALSDAGKEEIKKMLDMFEAMKTEVAEMQEVCDGYKILCENLEKDNKVIKARETELLKAIAEISDVRPL